MKKNSISAYVLCDGKSSRMGTDKGLIEFQGESFLSWILKAIPLKTECVFIVTEKEEYLQFAFPLVPDLVPDKGPVGGIYTALSHANTEWVMILSCDIPLIKRNMLEELISKSLISNVDIVFYSDGKNDYPLIACYRKELVSQFEKAVIGNRLKLMKLIDSLESIKIQVDHKEAVFLSNVNTQDNLEALTKRT